MLSIPERYARRTAVRGRAVELLARHGLRDWRLAFNRRKLALRGPAPSPEPAQGELDAMPYDVSQIA